MPYLRVLFVLAVMLIAPASQAYDVTVHENTQDLDIAAKKWNEITPSETKVSGLKNLDYLINLPARSLTMLDLRDIAPRILGETDNEIYTYYWCFHNTEKK